MKLTPNKVISGLTFALIAYLLFFLIIGIAGLGCRTIRQQRTAATTDSTATQVQRTDSSSQSLWQFLLQYGRTTERQYKPGRDSVIVTPAGEVKIIQLPGQVLTERIIETGKQQENKEENRQYTNYDSSLIQLLIASQTRQKETTTTPWYMWVLIAGMVLLFAKDFFKQKN